MTSTAQHELHIRRAIALARRAVERGNGPFGALLVDATGKVVLEAENTVLTERDSTGHAETNLLRRAGRELAPEVLSAATLYSSTEPCAMCAGAIFWAGLSRVVFGASDDRLSEIRGAPAIRLSCREVFARCRRPIEVVGPVLEDEACAVHADYYATGRGRRS